MQSGCLIKTSKHSRHFHSVIKLVSSRLQVHAWRVSFELIVVGGDFGFNDLRLPG